MCDWPLTPGDASAQGSGNATQRSRAERTFLIAIGRATPSDQSKEERWQILHLLVAMCRLAPIAALVLR